jgi:uncharacterized protein
VIFIDTGAIVGRLVARDQYYQAATAFWNELASSDVSCITTSLVMAEALTLVGRRTSYRFAAEQARELYSSDILHIMRPTHIDEINAVNLFEKFSDQRVSFVDCVSFVLMRRHKVQEVFGFDQHFSSAGFILKPSRL